MTGWPRRRGSRRTPSRIAFVAVMLATALEVGQALMGTGRASDTTDIVTNAAGAAVAIAAVRRAMSLMGPSRQSRGPMMTRHLTPNHGRSTM